MSTTAEAAAAATSSAESLPLAAGPLAIEKLSPAEERFERWRKRVGLVLAPLAFITVLLIPTSLQGPAHRLAAVMAAVIVLWITEALPMPVTALLAAVACVLLRVAPAIEVFAPFADPLMFLFIGSFILARAIFIHGLDRRFAFGVLSLRGVGAHPGRILIAFGAVTTILSGWIANTAATAMMFAIALSILAFLYEQEKRGGPKVGRAYATGLMLMTSFGASIGGLATPIGTAPNVIGLGLIKKLLNVDFTFFKWTLIGVPIVIICFIWLAGYLAVLCRAGTTHFPGAREMLLRERDRLGPWTTSQRSTLIAFIITVALWILPGVLALTVSDKNTLYQWVKAGLPEGVVALIGALLLFFLPGDRSGRAMTWDEAVRIDWGVVLLYGGGFALGILSERTGLARAVGEGLTSLLPVQGNEMAMLIAAATIAMLVSETTSNTASANMVVPVVIALSRSAGVDPLMPALGATFGASLGFMLPVSTPCNAIVYGSGYIPIGRMIRYGFLLDVIGVIVVIACVRLIVPLVR